MKISKSASKEELLQRLQFVVSVVCLVVVAYGFFVQNVVIVFVYTILFPLLCVVRFTSYYPKKYHYFLLDFCYFANLLVLVSLWVLPKSWELHLCMFGVVQATLVPSIALFRNMVVFHSFDRMTSFFIHFIAPLVVFNMRWTPEDINTDLVVENASSTFRQRLVWVCCGSTAVVLAHQILYVLIVEVFGRWCPMCFAVQTDQEFLTSYRYIVGKSKVLQRKLQRFPEAMRPLVMHMTFVVGNFFLSIPAALCYEYKAVHAVWIAIFGVLALWNGATFYTKALRKPKQIAPEKVFDQASTSNEP